jgi:hypothetical protein
MSWSMKVIPLYPLSTALHCSNEQYAQTSLLSKVGRIVLAELKNKCPTWSLELITSAVGRFRSHKLHHWIQDKICQLLVPWLLLRYPSFEILVYNFCLSTSKMQVSKPCTFSIIALEGVRTRSCNLHHRTQLFKTQNIDTELDFYNASIKIWYI